MRSSAPRRCPPADPATLALGGIIAAECRHHARQERRAPMDDQGFLPRLRTALAQPFPDPMTWTNVFLVIGFFMVATLAWRQVINMIGYRE
jgi:hypothetical protein